MDLKLFWLKVRFIAGAIADAVFGVMILIPSRMSETEFRYPMALAASLMFGWTMLLILGYQRPLERKGVLLLTIFPVITGLMVAETYRLVSEAIPPTRFAWIVGIEVGLVVLMGVSYLRAGRQGADGSRDSCPQ